MPDNTKGLFSNLPREHFDSVVPGKLVGNFGDVAQEALNQVSMPEQVLSRFEDLVSKMPDKVPGGVVLGALKNFTGPGPITGELRPYAEAVVGAIMPAVMDDAYLDKSEIPHVVARLGTALNSHEPDPALLTRASETLERLGVEDADGSLSKGLAQASVAVAVQAQELGVSLAMSQAVNRMPSPP